MRVTQSMLTNNMLKNLSRSYSNLDKYSDQLSTGKKVNRPSDDPVVAMKGMNYRSQLTEVEQFQRNLGEVYNWMDNSDSALDKATQALQRLRELAVQASNGTYEENQRESIAKEVDQLKEHLIDIANTKVNNKYIFNGTDTKNAPLTVDSVTGIIATSGTTNPVMIEVSGGTKLQANINPQNVFTDQLFADINEFLNALKSDNVANVQAAIGNLDTHIDNTVNERADLGARMNRLELIENRLAEQEVIATRTMSDNEDIDIEKVIVALTSQESIHRAALSGGSRIIQPTLLDFLR
ncbi:flagellar hook-associated protein FlgL [Bacillaceae bacterium S4-13-56]